MCLQVRVKPCLCIYLRTLQLANLFFFIAVKSQWRQVGAEPDNKKYRMEAAFASSSIPHTLVGRDFLFSATCPLEPLSAGTAGGCASGCFGPSANCIGTTCTCGRGYSRVGSNQVSVIFKKINLWTVFLLSSNYNFFCVYIQVCCSATANAGTDDAVYGRADALRDEFIRLCNGLFNNLWSWHTQASTSYCLCFVCFCCFVVRQ